MNNSMEPGTIHPIESNGKLIIATSNPRRGVNSIEAQIFKVNSINSDKVWEYPYKVLYSPKFSVIDPVAGTIKEGGSTVGDMLLFDPDNYFVHAKDSHAVYFYGFGYQKDKPGELFLLVDQLKY